MNPRDASVAARIPVAFDRIFVPLFFSPYAEVTGRRIAGIDASKILEVACGTGATTAAVHAALPDAEICATDLNQRMLDLAMKRVQSDKVRFEVADAHALPFPHKAFDMVICQFGVVMFQDRVQAHSEVQRVLRPGGRYWLTSWDGLDRFPAMKAASEALQPFLPPGCPNFMRDIIHAYGEPEEIVRDLQAGGFSDIELETIELTTYLDAPLVGEGLAEIPPILCELEKAPAGTIERAAEAMVEALAPWDGKHMPISAHYVTTRK